MANSRMENTVKNFMWLTVSTILSTVLKFITRTVFIYTIGILYLGVNGLFTNILSMLSLTELGIGIAINFSLYKPLAERDTEKIKALMYFYKKAYRIIALVVSVIGLSLLPFLDVLVKGGEGVEHLNFIYMIFLFNTAYSYLFTYKRTLLSADQKSYLITNINMVIDVITLAVQLVVLIIFENYYLYLVSAAILGVVQNFYVNHYINKRYPYLLDIKFNKMDKEDIRQIVTNVKAMMFHKFGELCINQTDNIIISSSLNITLVGLVSNYTLIINTVNMFIMNIFGAASASLGNLIATENYEKRLHVFNGYNFLAFWFFSWATLCFYVLLNPFVTLWIGQENVIDQRIINLIIINFYLTGMRVPLGNVKVAAGIYAQDQFVPLIQSAVNLIVSIVGVKYWGLAGVFLGTVLSSLVMPCWYRPIIVYKYVFNSSVKPYFIKYGVYILVLLVNIIVVKLISKVIFRSGIDWVSLFGMILVCLSVPNIIVLLLFKRSKDFQYIATVGQQMIRKVMGKRISH